MDKMKVRFKGKQLLNGATYEVYESDSAEVAKIFLESKSVNEYKYYLDTNSLTTRENNRLLWLHVIFPRIQPNGGTAATHYISVNCQKRTMNIYQSILYNSDNQEISKREQGSEGTTVTVNGNPPGWELICK